MNTQILSLDKIVKLSIEDKAAYKAKRKQEKFNDNKKEIILLTSYLNDVVSYNLQIKLEKAKNADTKAVLKAILFNDFNDMESLNQDDIKEILSSIKKNDFRVKHEFNSIAEYDKAVETKNLGNKFLGIGKWEAYEYFIPKSN